MLRNTIFGKAKESKAVVHGFELLGLGQPCCTT